MLNISARAHTRARTAPFMTPPITPVDLLRI